MSKKAAEYAASEDEDLASLATRFAYSKWIKEGPTVIGVSSVQELRVALESYWAVVDNKGELSSKDKRVAKHIQDEIFGGHLNETWQSGIER